MTSLTKRATRYASPFMLQTTGDSSGRFFLVVIVGLIGVVFILVAIFILLVGLIVARGFGFFVGVIVFVVIFILVVRLIVGRGRGFLVIAFFLVVFGRIGGFDRCSGGMVEEVFGSGFDALGGGRGLFNQVDIVNGIHGMPPWFGERFLSDACRCPRTAAQFRATCIGSPMRRSSPYDCKPAPAH
ncbi:conserved membrane hypothetical protein [Mesorhizobium plurifarium]|uniref:Uncharacterized protein n=1 Tax=Mesorhizobium plurifarium TaxID=69974 RepID=A0A0K2VWH0_MESPL|nr:conserved membrane hypothetical protein [Mesorhizobium plurifarium]